MKLRADLTLVVAVLMALASACGSTNSGAEFDVCSCQSCSIADAGFADAMGDDGPISN
jgi:hypothetical protein